MRKDGRKLGIDTLWNGHRSLNEPPPLGEKVHLYLTVPLVFHYLEPTEILTDTVVYHEHKPNTFKESKIFKVLV